MSRTATKPSALATCSPSATSVQKRQSSRGDGTNPLLREPDRAGGDQLADPRVDEPGRVVVAVPASRAVDEHAVGRSELRLPAPAAELVRERAQPRASLALDLPGNGVRGGGRGPRARRVRKHVHLRHPRALDDAERVLERGLVLAREADDDVARQVEVAERLELREELGGGVAPAHRAQHGVVTRLKWDVQMPGHRLGLAERGDELRCHVVDLDRRKPQARDARQLPRLAHETRERVAGLAVAEAAEVDAGEDYLGMTLCDPAADLGEYGAGAAAAGSPADERDDAERARERAAVLDLHERPRPVEPRVGLDAADRAHVAGHGRGHLLARPRDHGDVSACRGKRALEIGRAAG